MNTLRHCEYCSINDNRRVIWACQQCGKHFCSACFEKRVSPKAFQAMYRKTMLCPDCYLKKFGALNKTQVNKTINNRNRFPNQSRANLKNVNTY